MAEQFENGKRYRFRKNLMGESKEWAIGWHHECDGEEVQVITDNTAFCNPNGVNYLVNPGWCEEIEEEYKEGDIVEASGGYTFDPSIGKIIKKIASGKLFMLKILEPKPGTEEECDEDFEYSYKPKEIIGKIENYGKHKRRDETIEIRKNGKVIFEGKGQVKIKRNSKFESSSAEAYENGVSDFEINSGTTEKIYLEIKRGDDK